MDRTDDRFCYALDIDPLSRNPVTSATRRETSFEVDFEKVDAARVALGTSTLTETVDAALDEVIKLGERRRLVALLFDSGAAALADPKVTTDAWR